MLIAGWVVLIAAIAALVYGVALEHRRGAPILPSARLSRYDISAWSLIGMVLAVAGGIMIKHG